MKWQAIISKEHNGLTIKYVDAEGSYIQVYEEKEDNALGATENNKEHVVTMLYDLLDFFAECGSKHDKKRIIINYEKQKGE